MLTQQFRTFIDNIVAYYMQDEEDPQRRRTRTVKMIAEQLTKEGLEARYTGYRALRNLKDDLWPSLHQEHLTGMAIAFFAPGGINRDDMQTILDQYRICVENPATYVPPNLEDL
jgi:hypothetical protein